MSIWAIVPVKPINEAKTRLSSVLSLEQRADLVQLLLQHTLNILTTMEELSGVLVVSADPDVWQTTYDFGAEVLKEADVPGLNQSLQRSIQVLQDMAVNTILIVHADLPYLTKESLLPLVSLGVERSIVAIIPDRVQQGTNVMLMSPPGIIPLRYGEGSFIRHREETSHAGAYFIEIRPSPLSIDIDMPEDLTAEILDLLKTLRNSCRNGGWASGGLETVKQGESQRE